jgi:hypothetical protein
MAKGTLTVFNDVAGWLMETGSVNAFQWLSSGNWKLALISDGVNNLTATEQNPWFNPGGTGSTNITEVAAGGSYTSGGQVLSTLPSAAAEDTASDGIVVFRLNTATHTNGLVQWAQDNAGPTNIKTAVLYDNNTDFTPSRPGVAFIDLTEDGGSTAVSLASSGIDITFGTGGTAGDILTFTVNN